MVRKKYPPEVLTVSGGALMKRRKLGAFTKAKYACVAGFTNDECYLTRLLLLGAICTDRTDGTIPGKKRPRVAIGNSATLHRLDLFD